MRETGTDNNVLSEHETTWAGRKMSLVPLTSRRFMRNAIYSTGFI